MPINPILHTLTLLAGVPILFIATMATVGYIYDRVTARKKPR